MSATYTSYAPAILGAARQKANTIVRKAAFDLQTDAKRNTPVDTGYLVGSAFVRFESEQTAQIGFSAEYAIYVEKGTSPHGSHPGTPPQHMLGGAFERVAPSMQAAFRRLIP